MALQTPPALATLRARSGLEPAMARRLLVGLLLVVVMVASVGGWAATTPIGGAVIASGFVVVESNIKKVQHPTGGIVVRDLGRLLVGRRLPLQRFAQAVHLPLRLLLR